MEVEITTEDGEVEITDVRVNGESVEFERESNEEKSPPERAIDAINNRNRCVPEVREFEANPSSSYVDVLEDDKLTRQDIQAVEEEGLKITGFKSGVSHKDIGCRFWVREELSKTSPIH